MLSFCTQYGMLLAHCVHVTEAGSVINENLFPMIVPPPSQRLSAGWGPGAGRVSFQPGLGLRFCHAPAEGASAPPPPPRLAAGCSAAFAGWALAAAAGAASGRGSASAPLGRLDLWHLPALSAHSCDFNTPLRCRKRYSASRDPGTATVLHGYLYLKRLSQ